MGWRERYGAIGTEEVVARRRRRDAADVFGAGTPPVPDATGLELLAQELREADADAVLDTLFFRDRATLIVDPRACGATLARCASAGYGFLASVHGVDYYPEEPRLGVLYELLDMERVDRITVKLRVHTDAARGATR